MPSRTVEPLSHTVEERIRVIFVHLEALKHVAAMADEIDMPAPGFDTRQAFAAWVIRMADATGSQVALIEASLSVSCLNAEAPGRQISRK